jgi:hypothetical protein
MIINIGPERDLVIGEVPGIEVPDGVFDPQTLRVDFQTYLPIGRLAGSHYAQQRDRFTHGARQLC